MDTIRSQFISKINNNGGFSIIEALIAIAIFSIGFMAISTTIWTASSTTRTTAHSDLAMMAGQDMIEKLSSMPIDHSSLDGGTYEIESNGDIIEVEWEALNPTDSDGDGTPDFKTIAMQAFSQGELRMDCYYRRKIIQ